MEQIEMWRDVLVGSVVFLVTHAGFSYLQNRVRNSGPRR